MITSYDMFNRVQFHFLTIVQTPWLNSLWLPAARISIPTFQGGNNGTQGLASPFSIVCLFRKLFYAGDLFLTMALQSSWPMRS